MSQKQASLHRMLPLVSQHRDEMLGAEVEVLQLI